MIILLTEMILPKIKSAKKKYLEEDLYNQEKELKKLQRKSVQSGNTAFTASDLQQQTNIVNRKLNILLNKREKLNERYQDAFEEAALLLNAVKKNLGR